MLTYPCGAPGPGVPVDGGAGSVDPPGEREGEFTAAARLAWMGNWSRHSLVRLFVLEGYTAKSGMGWLF